MDIGDIYMVVIPPSNGHEQAGMRPAIIVQAAEFSQHLPTVLVVPLTSDPAAQTFRAISMIQPDAENGLRLPSVALVFQLRAIDSRRLGRKVGRLSAASVSEVQRHVGRLLGLGGDRD